MQHLPTGTVTLLFTDMESSTLLLQQLGKRYAGVLKECRLLLRTAFHAFGGQCKRQEESEPSAIAKLSHLLALQPVRTAGPVSVNSAESESSRLP